MFLLAVWACRCSGCIPPKRAKDRANRLINERHRWRGSRAVICNTDSVVWSPYLPSGSFDLDCGISRVRGLARVLFEWPSGLSRTIPVEAFLFAITEPTDSSFFPMAIFFLCFSLILCTDILYRVRVRGCCSPASSCWRRGGAMVPPGHG